MEREIEELIANLGVTYEEAKGTLEKEVRLIECICPFTGTIEYMEVKQ